METSEYFSNKTGLGILSTADTAGRVNSAVYSRPHFMDDGTVAIIMRDRLTHANLEGNPYANYLFVENGPGYKGKRLYLKKVREEKDSDLLYRLKRRTKTRAENEKEESKFLVFFELERELPLISEGGFPLSSHNL
jgi:Pyridoxamine 5'-phosphate oxidase